MGTAKLREYELILITLSEEEEGVLYRIASSGKQLCPNRSPAVKRTEHLNNVRTDDVALHVTYLEFVKI